MSDCAGGKCDAPYTVCNLRQEIGTNLVPSDFEDQLLRQLLNFDVAGHAYISMLQNAFRRFFNSEWSVCLRCCTILLDITWEHLNTGHWKDVDITWRHAYSLISLLKALCEYALLKPCDNLSSTIHSCDMGLLMGAPVLNNILGRLADKLQDIADQRKRMKVPEMRSENIRDVTRTENESDAMLPQDRVQTSVDNGVAVEYCPSLEHFYNKYMLTGTPVILCNCVDHWPAMTHNRWSVEYVRKVAGCRLVPIELGSKYTDDSWSQALMTVDEFFEKYVESVNDPGNVTAYLAQHQLFDQIFRLRKDILIPDYCALGTDLDENPVDVNAWFGPKGTVSPLHRDVKHNFLVQVVGNKYLRLYDPNLTDRLYPHVSHLLSTTSQVDVENPDLSRFPLFDGVPFTECVLGEGDMLYLPPNHWHFVRSLSVSFSVSFWWK